MSEIERKFRVDALPPGEHRARRIEQGYLAIDAGGAEVRLRRAGETTTLTVKSAPGLVRVEEEIPIDERQFESLWPLTEGRRIVKTRHLVALPDGLTAEVDEYGAALRGLLTAEVEFPSVEASEAFSAPAWVGREVTGDERYANRTLALRGAP
jgi:CYTH domain-containing protein